MNGLKVRIITGIIFVLSIIGGIYLDPLSFIFVFLLVNGFCLWEFFTMVLQRPDSKRNLGRKIIGLVLCLFPYLFISFRYTYATFPGKTVQLLFSGLFLMFLLSWIFELYAKSERPFTNMAFILFGLVYIGIPFSMLVFLGLGNGFNPNLIFGLLVLTWANDSFAYLVGSKMGKTLLFQRISPKKTWEGSLGGFVATLLVAIGLSVFLTELTRTEWLVVGILVSVFGTFGDLIESMLKRSYQVKDSGGILPGHGGFLDRFDGFIFLIPFVVFYLLLVKF